MLLLLCCWARIALWAALLEKAPLWAFLGHDLPYRAESKGSRGWCPLIPYDPPSRLHLEYLDLGVLIFLPISGSWWASSLGYSPQRWTISLMYALLVLSRWPLQSGQNSDLQNSCLHLCMLWLALTVEMNLEVGTPKDKLCIRIQRPGFSISRLHEELWGIGDLNLNVALMSYEDAVVTARKENIFDVMVCSLDLWLLNICTFGLWASICNLVPGASNVRGRPADKNKLYSITFIKDKRDSYYYYF